MTSTPFEIASLVAAELSSYGATVIYAPSEDLEKKRTRTVVVMPVGRDRKPLSRIAFDDVFTVHVGVFKHFSDNADAESLIADMEAIGEQLLTKKIGSYICTGIQWNPLYDFAAFRNHVFEGVIECQFKKV